MKYKNFFKSILIIITLILNFSSNSLAQDLKCGSKLITHIDDNIEKKYFHYNEYRNDAGIFFDFEWEKEQKKIIIRRDENNFPIIRFSLFNKENFIPNKTIVQRINLKDLSTLSDKDLIKQTYLSGDINFELKNEKNITISSRPYKLNDFKLSNFEILSIQNIDTTKGIMEMSFEAKLMNNRYDLKRLSL